MILAFEFTYLSHNGVLEHLLNEICLDYKIEYRIVRDEMRVTLYVQEEEERLGLFADFIAQKLPLSLFFKSSTVYVADIFPDTKQVLPLLTVYPSFTPKALESIETQTSEKYLSPYPNFVMGQDELTLVENTKKGFCASTSDALEHLFINVVNAISEGKKVYLRTLSGEFVIGNIENAAAITAMEGVEIIPTDLSVVEKMVVIRENEVKALASLERPSIRFKVNAVFASKKILKSERVFMRLADEWLLHHLCKRLFRYAIPFIFKAPASLLEADVSIETSCLLEQSSALSVCVLENGEIILLKGERYASRIVLENRKRFDEASHAAYASILQEHHLFSANSSCFYLSMHHDDRFMSYSQENEMLNLTSFSFPTSFETLFLEIAQSSKSASRLLENYKEAFPDLIQNVLMQEIPQNAPKNIYTLWSIASVLLGFTDRLSNGAQTLVTLAEDFGGQKGPRMDYFLEKEETLVSNFDYVRLFRSGISFKLAGTDDATLSFGYMQSLAYFLSDTMDYYKENLLTKECTLAGSLFGYRRLSEMVYKNIKPNHTICFNRELPIDTEH